MAAQPTPLTLEEFHRRYDGAKPAYEYWYGEAIQKPMPTIPHGLVQLIIGMLLKNAGWHTVTETRLKVVSEAEPVPDVIATRRKFKSRYPESAPELCIEILSPADRLSKVFDKAKKYILWGTQRVWIVDPEKRTAWTLSQESGSEPEWIPPDGSLRASDTEITMAVLFEEVDKSLESFDEE